MAKKIKEFAEKRTGDLHITGLNRVYEYFPLSDVWTIFKPTGTKTVLQCTSEVCVMSKQIRNNTFICTMTTFCKCQIVIYKKNYFSAIPRCLWFPEGRRPEEPAEEPDNRWLPVLSPPSSSQLFSVIFSGLTNPYMALILIITAKARILFGPRWFDEVFLPL